MKILNETVTSRGQERGVMVLNVHTEKAFRVLLTSAENYLYYVQRIMSDHMSTMTIANA